MTEPPSCHAYPPEIERVHRKAVAEIERLLPGLSVGESLGARWIMTREGLRVSIEPKRIEIA